MRIFLTALILAIMLGLAWISIPVMHDFDIVNVLALITGEVNIESVAKEPPLVFVAPKQHFKVSFPGKPHELTESNSWLHRSMLHPPSYFVADKAISFWASERTINDWETPGKFPYTPITNKSKIDIANGNRALSNNDAAARSMANSPIVQVQNFLDYKCSEAASAAGGKVESLSPCDTGGGLFLGQSAQGIILSDKEKFRMKMFYDSVNKRVFTVVVIGVPERVDSTQSTQFLNSLAIWQ